MLLAKCTLARGLLCRCSCRVPRFVVVGSLHAASVAVKSVWSEHPLGSLGGPKVLSILIKTLRLDWAWKMNKTEATTKQEEKTGQRQERQATIHTEHMQHPHTGATAAPRPRGPRATPPRHIGTIQTRSPPPQQSTQAQTQAQKPLHRRKRGSAQGASTERLTPQKEKKKRALHPPTGSRAHHRRQPATDDGKSRRRRRHDRLPLARATCPLNRGKRL